MDAQQAALWLSEARSSPFLAAEDGDLDRALALHAWHGQLSVAAFGMVQEFELLLRNTLGAG